LFRFWLKGEEDLDPAKAEQYARWRALQDESLQKRASDAAKALKSERRKRTAVNWRDSNAAKRDWILTRRSHLIWMHGLGL